MSHPSRPRGRGPAQRRRRRTFLEPVQVLEERQLLAPILSIYPEEPDERPGRVIFTPADEPTNTNLGSVEIIDITEGLSAAPFTSVSLLTPLNSFGGNMVRIEAGPGGDFGKGVYAITRGFPENAPNQQSPLNRPGVIYRVDPATGRTSVFFDLNTVMNQIVPGEDASNDLGRSTGLVNWYDIAFDPEGYFDGRPSMFVSSVDRINPLKNAVYRIGPDGSFMGLFVQFSQGLDEQRLIHNPSAILVPPVEQQQFLRGLFTGAGLRDPATGNFAALFFDANGYRPGQNIADGLPFGVFETALTFGPQTAIISANLVYLSQVYSTFTDFGTPPAAGIPPRPGLSGVQGLGGELLINGNINFPIISSFTDIDIPVLGDEDNPNVDIAAAILTPFRRFMDAAFDHYGYFTYSTQIPVPDDLVANDNLLYQGSLFVADLASGLSIVVTPEEPLPDDPVLIPIQGEGVVGVELDEGTGEVIPIFHPNGRTTVGPAVGGRIIRIDPDGTVTPFAENFNTSARQDSLSFLNSTLSITFSADGTTLYASDNDGIWQFKTTNSLAGSSAGSIVGLNDLRSLGVPYEGQDMAVAIVDSGVDADNPAFRGRVAPGRNLFTRGFGNDDTAVLPNGHGTPLAGVVAQFVPQATLEPVNVFTPTLRGVTLDGAVSAAVTGDSTVELLYNGLDYVARNPFVSDPVRFNTQDRVVAAAFGFGTVHSFETEGTLFRRFPQLTIAYKNQLRKLRQLGISPVTAAGQFTAEDDDFPNPLGIGNPRGMPFPAIFNETVSVTGTYPFPFRPTAMTPPTDPTAGIIPRPPGPITIFGANNTIEDPLLEEFTLADITLFADKLVSTADRGFTTDFAAPAIDVPTFRRTGLFPPGDNLTFVEGGTSLSAGIATGSFALVSSALDYWAAIGQTGVTVDAYLTQPVGAHTLNFGPHGIRDLSAYANPDGVNAILQWTAVPILDDATVFADAIPLDDANRGIITTPRLIGQEQYRTFSRIDVGNAVAAIEGSIALAYLFNHGIWDFIDTNNNGLVTAQELQTFVDNAATIGMPEAGAMARLLGGTARPPDVAFTFVGDQPDQRDVLQRRFNFFDYAADGQLNGAISIEQFQMLAHTLLPLPDSFVVVDRQRASVNGYLLDPLAKRNWTDLQKLLPQYAWVPPGILTRFRNWSPARFHFARGINPSATQPWFTLFERAGEIRAARELAAASSEPLERGNARADRANRNTPPASRTAPTTVPTDSAPDNTLPIQAPTLVSQPNTSPPASSTSQADQIVAALQGIARQGQAQSVSTSAAQSIAPPSASTVVGEATKIGPPTPAGTVATLAMPADGDEHHSHEPGTVTTLMMPPDGSPPVETPDGVVSITVDLPPTDQRPTVEDVSPARPILDPDLAQPRPLPRPLAPVTPMEPGAVAETLPMTLAASGRPAPMLRASRADQAPHHPMRAGALAERLERPQPPVTHPVFEPSKRTARPLPREILAERGTPPPPAQPPKSKSSSPFQAIADFFDDLFR